MNWRAKPLAACLAAAWLGIVSAGAATALTCPPAARDDCRRAATNQLELRRDAADPGGARLKWRWTRGQATLSAAFGDPTVATTSGLCVYDAGGLVQSVVVAGGANWSARTSGFRFVDGGAPQGVSRALLGSNSGDRAKAMLNGSGAALPDVALPLTPPVVAQLINDSTGVCLETRFDAGAVSSNAPDRFRAKQVTTTPTSPLPPRPSSACGAPISAYAHGANSGTVVHDGRTRSFGVYVPAGYDLAGAAAPAPLVVLLHGGFGSGAQAFATARMAALADARGAIVVYPDGIASPAGIRTWNAGACCGYAQATGIDDVGFIDALLDRLADELCLDRRRVYATGMSNGAELSHRLACDRSCRFAAIAPVAGTDETLSCAPTRPVPVLQIHGSADQNSPYFGGAGCGVSGVPHASVPDTIAGWRDRDDCPGPLAPAVALGDTTCQTQGRCRSPAEIALCTVVGGGHTWPGGEPPVISGIGNCPFGAQSTTFDASAYMFDFFARHALP